MGKVRTFAGRELYADPRHALNKRKKKRKSKQVRFVRLPSPGASASPAKAKPATIREAYLADGLSGSSPPCGGSRIQAFIRNKVERLDEQLFNDSVHAQQALLQRQQHLRQKQEQELNQTKDGAPNDQSRLRAAQSNLSNNDYFQPGGGVSARGNYMLNKVEALDRQECD